MDAIEYDLKVDHERYFRFKNDAVTGIMVRARVPAESVRWESVDIYVLTKESLLEWLRSRGGKNPWAEDVVGILLEHGHLHSTGE